MARRTKPLIVLQMVGKAEKVSELALF